MDRKYTVIKDKADFRDSRYSDRHKARATYTTSFDLRPKCSPVVDQGQLGSCTANAIVSGVREFVMINDEKRPMVGLSRLFIYWYEREMEGDINEDGGASLRDGMKAITNIGVCTESLLPYDVTKFTIAPNESQIKEASNYKLSGYQRVSSLVQMKDALIHSHPIAMSMTIFESFESEDVAKTGIVPMPQPNEQQLGGHATCIVGFDDKLHGGCFIVRNSWGDSWGDKGYFYLPYGMLKYFMDAWTVQYGKKFLSDYLPNLFNVLGYVKNKLNFK